MNAVTAPHVTHLLTRQALPWKKTAVQIEISTEKPPVHDDSEIACKCHYRGKGKSPVPMTTPKDHGYTWIEVWMAQTPCHVHTCSGPVRVELTHAIHIHSYPVSSGLRVQGEGSPA